eukprot:11781006-Alexandrium_andersonii.AAC.1
MHQRFLRPNPCTQKALLSDALNQWRRDLRELEAAGSPPSKEGTLASLKALVAGLRAELQTTLEIVDMVAPRDVAKIFDV